MSRGAGANDVHVVCFPRVSGDEPSLDTVAPPGGEFSPRERG